VKKEAPLMIHRIGEGVVLLLVLVLVPSGAWSALAQETNQPQASAKLAQNLAAGSRADPPVEFKPGELLVKFRAGASRPAAQHRLDLANAMHARNLLASDVQVWRVPEGQELVIVEQLNADPTVAFAQPNYAYRAFSTPDDPGYSQQWAHPLIGSPQAWDITTGSAGVTIAVIDTGVDGTHPDLINKIVPGFDFVDHDSEPRDEHGHGTHVAGIAAATSNNSAGITGLDWQARIMPIRVLDEYGVGWDSDIADGITWAYQNGAKVLNLSLGGPGYSYAMQESINSAHAAGSLVVAAMGNCRASDSYACPAANPTAYPAAYDNVMAVAATNRWDAYAYFSQYGNHCDIAAPGGEMSYLHDSNGIYSTMPTYPVYLSEYSGLSTSYDQLQGTSQATPYVAGLAALLWSVNSATTPDDIQHIIQSTAVDLGPLGWDVDYGHGRISVQAALEAVAVPQAVSDLRITHAAAGEGILTVTLRWSAPTVADTFEIRYGRSALNLSNWPNSDVVIGSLPGSVNQYIATVPFSGDTVYFGLRSRTASGTLSGPSNNAFWPSRNQFLPLVIH
jgi:thermitase